MSQDSEDLYGDGAPQGAPSDPSQEPDDSQGGDSSDESTSILPLSFFPSDVKPGDTATIKVVAVHENEVEVEPAEDEEPSDESSPSPDNEAAEGEPPDPNSMGSMMQ